jgi:parallel beta-helix repeat protein
MRYALALLFVALSAIAGCGGAASGQTQPCMISVRPGESIQAAIDAALPGTVICLAAGEWQETLVISKSLALSGAGLGATTICGNQEDGATIRIQEPGEEEVAVVLAGLTVTGPAGSNAAASLAEGDSQVTIAGCTISRAGGSGIRLRNAAQVTLTGCTVSENTYSGIALADSAMARIADSRLSRNGGNCVHLADRAVVSIVNSTISENSGAAILVLGSAQASITSSIISWNDGPGIMVGYSGEATITDCTLSGNEVGIDLWASAYATVLDSRILRNRQQGVYVDEEPCSEDPAQYFTGLVTGRGNTIPSQSEPDGNKGSAFCPDALGFLATEQGGELDRTALVAIYPIVTARFPPGGVAVSLYGTLPGQYVVPFEWAWGDGTATQGDQWRESHTYPADGVYSGSVTVRTRLGTTYRGEFEVAVAGYAGENDEAVWPHGGILSVRMDCGAQCILDPATGEAALMSRSIRSVSGDGQVVVYEEWTEGAEALYISGPHFESKRLLRIPVQAYIATTSLSPDGRFLAYDAAAGDGGPRELFVMDLSNGVSQQLTSDGKTALRCFAWLPTGEGILYHNQDEILKTVFMDGRPSTQVRVGRRLQEIALSPDGSILACLDIPSLRLLGLAGEVLAEVPLPMTVGAACANTFGIAWSRDGASIVLGVVVAPDGISSDSACAGEVYVVRRDGSSVTRLTNNDYSDWVLDWLDEPVTHP